MKHPVDVYVGKRIRHRRWMNGTTQQQLAENVGIKFQQIQKYEIGSNRIAASRLFELAQIFDLSPAYFFDGLHEGAQSDTAPRDPGMEIVNALASIRDETVKSRIVTFIEDVSGMTVARQG